MKEAPGSSETSVLARATWRNISEYDILHRIYKTIILSVVLCECETWSLILREEHRLREFDNRVLRRIFGPKRD
jgi:hypothetical protein